MRKLLALLITLLALLPILAFSQQTLITRPEQPGWINIDPQQVPQASEEQTYDTKPLDCGLVTNYSGHRIGDGCLQEALNVLLDDDHGVQRRDGYIKFNQSALDAPIRRIYPFDAPDGSKFLVAVSSDKIYSAEADGAFSVIPGFTGLSEEFNTDCTTALGRFWCVNPSDGLIFWNGDSTGVVAGAPLGNLIDTFRNRIVISDISSQQSQVALSGFLDGEDWVTADLSTSPAVLSMDGINDGNKVTCLMGTYQDTFMIGKETRLFGLYGFDNRDFTIREFSREVGCLDDASVQEKDDSLFWLSQRGIERLRGTKLDWRISDPIFDIIDLIVESAGNSRFVLDTSQADFESGDLIASGTGAPMSSTISPDNVVPTTFSVVDTSSADFNSGALVAVSTERVTDSVILGTTTAIIDNGDFETGTLFGWGDINLVQPANGCTGFVASSITATSVGALQGSFSMSYIVNQCNSACTDGGAPNLRFQILDGDDDSQLSDNFLGDALSADQTKVFLLPGGIDKLRIRFNADSPPSSDHRVISSTFGVINASDFSSSLVGVRFKGSGISGTCNPGVVADKRSSWLIDFIQKEVFFDTGTVTSRIFDTGFSTPTPGIFSATTTFTDGENSIYFDVRSSTSGNDDLWTDWLPTTDTLRLDTTQQYWQYRARFNTTLSTTTPVLGEATLRAATTGQFRSQCLNTSSAITDWGLFRCDAEPFDGSFSFEVSTGSACDDVETSTATFSSIANNSFITLGTAAYISYRTTFDFDTFITTGNMILRSCTINWEEGASRPEVASAVYDHRYHIFFTTETTGSPSNTEALVLDKFDRWTRWDGTPARSAVLYDRKLMAGSGSAGQVFNLYESDDDDGAGFTSTFRTKDLDLGNWRTQKQLSSVWLEFQPEADPSFDIIMQIYGHIDRTSRIDLKTVNLDEDTGLIAADVPWPLDNQPRGRYIGIEVTNTGTQPWKYYRGSLQYRPTRED